MTKLPFAALALSSVVVLGACTNPSTLNPDDPNRNTVNGAIAGSLVGAGLAALTGGKGGQVVAGAAAGALVGGLIGQNLDKQAAELRAQMTSDGITITNTGDKLIVTLPQDITFGTDSYTVRASLRSDLGKLADNLLKYPDSTVQVIGHTDNVGDATYNIGLSQRRAGAVADILQADGVTYDRISTSGRGEVQPVASNLTPEGRAQNRRVEIVVTPRQS
jgi:outer membrane protein OmpA-like peptidoglycan-associated protein